MHVEREQLAVAHSTARQQLLSERNHDHWTGELSSSPLCTAAAISALVLAERHVDDAPEMNSPLENSWHSGMLVRSELSELLSNSLRWLARQQNQDGGWGDVDCGHSTLAATLMVQAAFHLTGVPAKYADLLHSSERYIESQGGLAGLKKQFADDKPFVAAILTNCAMAGIAPWRKVPALPLELTCLPKACYQLPGLAGLGNSLPVLISIGQARDFYFPSRNPLAKWLRQKSQGPCHNLLAQAQGCDGSFSASVLHTSFVIIGLASHAQSEDLIVRRGVNYLLSNVRSDGSWSYGCDQTISNTVRAVRALDWNFNDPANDRTDIPSPVAEAIMDWLLAAQISSDQNLPSSTGGWSFSRCAGAAANSLDTAATLGTLAEWCRKWPRCRTAEVTGAALDGIRWLIERQNRDGGWAYAMRGVGGSSMECSSTDATCESMMALSAWKNILRRSAPSHPLISKIERGLLSGVSYLKSQQQPDGSWWPRWYGSEAHTQGANPVIGTAQVVRVFGEMQLWQTTMAQKAFRLLF